MLPYRDSRIVKITLTVFFVLLLGYAYYEARAMLYGPRITVPQDTIVIHEAFTAIKGRAEHISELRMNGTAISVTEEGDFEEPYLLTPGENRIILDATDRFGRTQQEIIEIIYIPGSATPASQVAPEH
jgi:hypothetical protein